MCMYVPPPPKAFDELGGRVASPSNGGCHEEGPQEQSKRHMMPRLLDLVIGRLEQTKPALTTVQALATELGDVLFGHQSRTRHRIRKS